MSKLVLNLANTPCAGSPYEIHCAINEDYTEWRSELAQGKYAYNDGRVYGRGYLLDRDKSTVDRLIEEADAFIFHNNGPMGPNDVRNGKSFVPDDNRPKMWLQHSPYWWWTPWSWGKMSKFRLATWCGMHSLIWKQAMPISINVIPQIVNWPKWCPEVPEKNWNDIPIVSWAPSHRGFGDMLHVKGYPIVDRACTKLQKEGLIYYDMIESLPADDCLMRKMYSHIGIDEVVTGGYHRNLLEACALGLAPITGMSEPVMHEMFSCIEHLGAIPPWGRVTAGIFEKCLGMMARNVGMRRGMAKASRAFMEQHWHPHDLLKRFYYPLLADGCREVSQEEVREAGV
jgi:hypothetical protein